MEILDEIKRNGPECIFLTSSLETSTDTFEYRIIAVINQKQHILFKTRNPITAVDELNACNIKYGKSFKDSESIKSIEKCILTLEDYVTKVTADKKAEIEKLNSLTKKELIEKAREMKKEFKTSLSKEEIINIIVEP